METPPSLVHQARGIIQHYSLDTLQDIGIGAIQQELEEVEEKIRETRARRFTDVEQSHYTVLSVFDRKWDDETFPQLRKIKSNPGISKLLTCYSEIRTEHQIALEEIQRVFINRVKQHISDRNPNSLLSDGLRELSTNSPRIQTPPQRLDSEAYNKAFENVKTHLSTILNPVIVNELVQAFKTITQRSVDGRHGIISYFATLRLPEDTRLVLTEYDEQIKSVCRIDSQAKLEVALTVINLNLESLAKHKASPMYLWDELEDLLSLNEVRTLTNDVIKGMLRLVKADRTDELRQYLKEKLKESDVDLIQLDQNLEAQGKFDLNTMIGQVIENRPLETSGVITHWGKPLDFFKGKTLIFGSTLNIGNPSGQIVKCWQDDSNSKYFELDTEFVIQVTLKGDQIDISVKKYLAYRLLRMIHRKDTDSFEVESSVENSQDSKIPSGTYRLTFDYTKLKWWDPLSGVAMLTNDRTKQRYLISQRGEEYSIANMPKDIFSGWRPQNVESLSRDAFLKTYLAKRECSNTSFTVDKEKCEKLIVIKEEVNEARVKIAQRKSINQIMDNLRSQLLQAQSQSLLLKLTDNLVANRLEKIDVELASLPNSISIELEAISQKLKDYFQTTNSPLTILKKVVLETIYAQLDIKFGTVAVANTMELLQQAQIHTDKLKDKDGIIVLGETGVGKSSCIASLAGATMEQTTNLVGDKVIILSPNNRDKNLFPTIGQSLGISETIYVQGYDAIYRDLLAQGVVLIDCPGFSETRGTEWELCANLSVDEAVTKLHEIRSLVVVASFSAFQDRANGILDLVYTVRERFPNSFIPGKPELSSLHLIITKAPQTGAEAERQLGNRIAEHINEIETQMEKDAQDRIEKIEADESTRRALENKKSIWLALQEMHTNGQIHFIDPLNKAKVKTLFTKLSTRKRGDFKQSYAKSMKIDRMHNEFHNTVELSTETWTHIFKQYQDVIPTAIANTTGEIGRRDERLKLLAQDKIQRADKIREYEKMIVELETFIVELNKARNSPAQATEEIYRLLEVSEKSNAEQELDLLEKELKQLQEKIISKSTELSNAQKDVEKTQAQIDRSKFIYDLQKQQIGLMSTGDKAIVLAELHFEPTDPIEIVTLKPERGRPGAMSSLHRIMSYFFNHTSSTAYWEIRDYTEDEVESQKTVLASEVNESLDHLIIIDKEYRLVPTDPKMQKEFSRAFKASGADGTYEAKVEGENFSRVRFNVATSGKKLAYHFTTNWKKGGPLPWVKITYSIPNKEFFAATITNKSAQLKRLKAELKKLPKTLGSKEPKTGQMGLWADIESEYKTLDERAKLLPANITAKKMEIQNLSSRISTRIEDLLKEKTSRVSALIKEKEALELSKEIEEKTKRVEQELVQLQINLEVNRRIKRNLALTIKTKWDTACLLRKFASTILSGTTKNTEGEEHDVLKLCREFIADFDQCKETILGKCQEDLKL